MPLNSGTLKFFYLTCLLPVFNTLLLSSGACSLLHWDLSLFYPSPPSWPCYSQLISQMTVHSRLPFTFPGLRRGSLSRGNSVASFHPSLHSQADNLSLSPGRSKVIWIALKHSGRLNGQSPLEHIFRSNTFTLSLLCNRDSIRRLLILNL